MCLFMIKMQDPEPLFQYIKLFIETGFNVKFIGDNFVKHEPYTSVLEQMGVEVLYGTWYQEGWKDWIISNSRFIDYVYLNRPHISIKYIDFLKKNTNAKLLYQGHDLHYLREYRRYEIEKDESILQISKDVKKQEFEIFNNVDLTCFFSEIEINEIKKELPNINAAAILLNIFDVDTKKRVNFSNQRRDILFVGGFGHLPNADAVMWFTKKIFSEVIKKIPDIKFYIVGSNPPANIKALESENIVVTGYISDEELNEYYKNCRIVVAPLRYGAGIKGKILEAIYNQVPVITTPVGAEGLPDANEILVVANNAEEFRDKLIYAYNNIEYLRKISDKSLDYIKNNFSKENTIEILSKYIEFTQNEDLELVNS